MRRKIVAITIVIVVSVFAVKWCQARPKEPKVATIAGFLFVGKMDIAGGAYYAEDIPAHLYRNEKVYWVRYVTSNGKIKDIILPREPRDTITYNSVNFVSEDSCILIKR